MILLGRVKLLLSKKPIFLKSYLYALVEFSRALHKSSFHEVFHRHGGVVEYYQELHASEAFESCKEIIKQMSDFLKERKIRFIVVIAPEILSFDDFRYYPYRNIHQKLLSLKSNHIEVIDPLDNIIALGVKPKDLWVIPSDCHKNRQANQVIAETVAQHILLNE
jgi:hypothetical protein